MAEDHLSGPSSRRLHLAHAAVLLGSRRGASAPRPSTCAASLYYKAPGPQNLCAASEHQRTSLQLRKQLPVAAGLLAAACICGLSGCTSAAAACPSLTKGAGPGAGWEMDEVDCSSLQRNHPKLSSTPATLWSSHVTALQREIHLSQQAGLRPVTAPRTLLHLANIWQLHRGAEAPGGD